MRQEKTTVWVPVELQHRLKLIGSMGDTYADVIERLLDHYHNCPKVRWKSDKEGVSHDQA